MAVCGSERLNKKADSHLKENLIGMLYYANPSDTCHFGPLQKLPGALIIATSPQRVEKRVAPGRLRNETFSEKCRLNLEL